MIIKNTPTCRWGRTYRDKETWRMRQEGMVMTLGLPSISDRNTTFRALGQSMCGRWLVRGAGIQSSSCHPEKSLQRIATRPILQGSPCFLTQGTCARVAPSHVEKTWRVCLRAPPLSPGWSWIKPLIYGCVSFLAKQEIKICMSKSYCKAPYKDTHTHTFKIPKMPHR